MTVAEGMDAPAESKLGGAIAELARGVEAWLGGRDLVLGRVWEDVPDAYRRART
ncbi:MAG: hypothetical protein U0166_00450 [Acidobacteriota bacterium]